MTKESKHLVRRLSLSVVFMVSGILYMSFPEQATSLVSGASARSLTQKLVTRAPASVAGPVIKRNASQPVTESAVAASGLVTSSASDMTLQSKVSEFAAFQKKAILQDEERLRKLELLQDPVFLQEVGRMLRNPNLIADSSNIDVGVDLLLEARKYSEHQLVDQVLADIVGDRSIEDGTGSLEQRERLAQAKAEIMYRWSSVDSVAANQIPRLLPGSVSEKIWRNVVALQTQNSSESMKVAERFARTGSHLGGEETPTK